MSNPVTIGDATFWLGDLVERIFDFFDPFSTVKFFLVLHLIFPVSKDLNFYYA